MTDHDPNTPNVDGADDLTRFLDEDFGTEEVDLFEFTSGEEDSPLTQLKSIVLGLDWEITDEALQDLADEIENLRYLEQFEHDKVSQVYLQALDKIGNYILTEGAHAHQNAIKLLLSLYYDFEKIISSELITGAEITALLKADVRKFKILQYQIAQKHGATVPEAAAAAAELPITEHKTLLDIHAAILELDWEVTDEGLNHLSEQLNLLKEQFTDNRYIIIVVRGLETLNKYIYEERARTHPEAFSLLHHFFEALETLVDDKELDDENSQKILISCVNRLNALKSLITKTPQELEEEAITPVAEEAETPPPPPEEEKVAEAVAEPGEEPEPGEEKIEGVAGELEAADVLDVELPTDEAGEVAPALFDSGEESAVALEEEAPPEELEEKLDFFFGEDEEVTPPPPEEEEVAEAVTEPDEEPSKKIEGVAGELEASDELDVELPTDETGEVAPALFDSGDEGETVTADEEAPSEELAEKLDFFFGEDEEVTPPPPEEEEVAEAVTEPDEEPSEKIEGVAGEAEAEDVLDVELPMDETGEVAPALSDSGEEEGEVAALEGEAPPDGLEEKLDFFFGEDEESFEPEAVEEAVAQKEAEEEERAETERIEKEKEEEILSVSPALTGETEPDEPVVEEALETAPEDLDEKLESFFESEGLEAAEETTSEEEAAITEEPSEEVPEELFDEEDEEEVLLTPELAAEEEIVEPEITESVDAISSPEDYNAALEKMKAEFQEREQSLMDEIASLKEEIESLKSQLQ